MEHGRKLPADGHLDARYRMFRTERGCPVAMAGWPRRRRAPFAIPFRLP